ncbi:hypothetical protein [Microbacterium sp. SORGH_AS_0888]|uniref:hypothetical protein n=1 Tax=Microbacterium sp. SORGH_AS_0888 TaxID=3041791 RepID=UPI002787AE0E|nr:hypothetical protein [Microbacterium sp. SORGH_AS_0888]MDQ1130887.1 hypothetical protein [Microbacterium sp. SORGH_AS_0888]
MKRVLIALLLAATVVVGGAVVLTKSASAASPGAGFGAWEPVSAYGWHGSMRVNGIDTYCIFPGRPVPTGESVDHGLSFDAAGLDPQRLTAINMLVSRYGQTSDPVQAASVGWAVKAIADWDETLHTFGYPGDSLQGAIHWTFSALAPAQDQAVQDLAAAYYTEAMAQPAGPAQGSGRLEFTADAADSGRGTVTVHADVAARGTVTLENAVFADTGSPVREDATAGATYELIATPPSGAATYTVRGSGTLRGGFLPAVRYMTTPGGQDTAGPGGELEFPVAGEDATPRDIRFAPQISTQVVSRYVPGGRYIDDVSFSSAKGPWARTADGGYAPVSATASVYRTATEPQLADTVPADAEEVGALTVTTDVVGGPEVPYRVESEWQLPGPGFYTAVWRIEHDRQTAGTQAVLEPGYVWVERFGEVSQVTAVTAVSSAAEPVVAVGASMSDVVIVSGAVPSAGLDVSTEVFRVPDGVVAGDACTPENSLWRSESIRIHAAGSTSFTAPAVPDFGTYVWRERATDTEGVLVHEGLCGVEEETTRAPRPTVTTTAQASTGLGGEARDVATVAGPIPATGPTEITFDLYRSPGGEPAAACTPETLVTSTAAVTVIGPGEVASPGVRLHETGTYFWIERLWHGPAGGERTLLAEGTCGQPNETTVVTAPEVATVADERVAVGAPYADTATVTGLGEGADAELVFTVYRSSGDAPVCTDETRETVTPPIAVTGPGEYRSPEVSSRDAGVRHWIAELRYRAAPTAEPLVVHRGTCGEAGETTRVDLLAATGPDAAVVGGVAGVGGLSALILGGIALWVRHSHRARP